MSMFDKSKNIVEFLKNVAIIIAFIGLTLEFLVPQNFRQLKAELDFDRSWYFVGTWDSRSKDFFKPRFTSGTTARKLALGPEKRLPGGAVLLPFKTYTRDSISESALDLNMLIVGRSMPTTTKGEITYLPSTSDCLYVHDTSVTPSAHPDREFVWVFASAQGC
jgi:hypothetical protein